MTCHYCHVYLMYVTRMSRYVHPCCMYVTWTSCFVHIHGMLNQTSLYLNSNGGNVLFITQQIASTQVFLYTSVQLSHMINHTVVCNKDKYCPLTNIIILSKSDIIETHRVCVNVDICHAVLIQIRLTFIYQCLWPGFLVADSLVPTNTRLSIDSTLTSQGDH